MNSYVPVHVHPDRYLQSSHHCPYTSLVNLIIRFSGTFYVVQANTWQNTISESTARSPEELSRTPRRLPMPGYTFMLLTAFWPISRLLRFGREGCSTCRHVERREGESPTVRGYKHANVSLA